MEILRIPDKILLAALHRLAVPLVLSATLRLAIGILLGTLICLAQAMNRYVLLRDFNARNTFAISS